MTKGELTRQHILEQAAPLFNQRGFAGTCTQAILEATGLEKGGLYRHFTSKEELAAESFRYTLRKLIQARHQGRAELTGALPKLRHMVRAFVHVPSPVAGGCPLANIAADADSTTPAVLALAREGIATWKRELCAILRGGIRTGELRRDLHPGRTANLLIATLEGALMISRLEGRRTALKEAQTYLDKYLDGLAD